MIKLIIFDASGTLVKHDWDPAGIACSVARELGINVEPDAGRAAYETVYTQFGTRRVEVERTGDYAKIAELWNRMFSAWLKEAGQDTSRAEEMAAWFKQRAFSEESGVWGLFSDVEGALRELADEGYRLGVVSNWDHTLHVVLQNLGIRDSFDFVIASLEFGAEKPDPAIFHEALRLGGVKASEAVHVGDSFEDDYQGAERAGLKALFLDRNGRTDLREGRIESLCRVSEAIRCLK